MTMRELLAACLLLIGIICFMTAVIAIAARIGKRLLQWADERDRAEQDERIEAERAAIAAMREAAVRAYHQQ